MSQEDFFKNLGTYDEDGNIITRVATQIKNYPELSLVAHGADPFAQKVNEKGEIVNPIYAGIEMNSMTPKQKMRQKYFTFDFKTDIIANSKKITIPKKLNNINHSAMNKLIALLNLTLGLKLDQTKPNLKVVKNTIKKLQSAGSIAEVEMRDAIKESRRLKKEMAAQKELAEKRINRLKAFKNNTVKSLRKETKKNFLLISNGAPNAKTLSLIEEGDFATLSTLNDQYKTQLEEKYPLSCKECGSENVSRASVNGGHEEDERVEADDMQDVKLRSAASKAINFMHDPEEPKKTK